MAVKRIHGAAVLAAAVPIGAAGTALMKHGSFGLTPFYSVSLALYHATGLFTMGTWNTVYQVVLILTLMAILRRFKMRYVLSFAVAAITSVILDLFNSLCLALPATLPVRIVCYAAGFLLLTLGVALMAECKLPVSPMNLFVRELSEEWNRPFRNVKLGFDLGCLIISVTISLCFTGHLNGVGPGTIVSALLTGPMSGIYIAWLRRHFCITIST